MYDKGGYSQADEHEQAYLKKMFCHGIHSVSPRVSVRSAKRVPVIPAHGRDRLQGNALMKRHYL